MYKGRADPTKLKRCSITFFKFFHSRWIRTCDLQSKEWFNPFFVAIKPKLGGYSGSIINVVKLDLNTNSTKLLNQSLIGWIGQTVLKKLLTSVWCHNYFIFYNFQKYWNWILDYISVNHTKCSKNIRLAIKYTSKNYI